jgi:hypothetical protein
MEPNITKKIGYLLISGAVALLIPYTILIVIFNYPLILRQDTATILTRFHEGGQQLIWTWFAFAATGIPLIPAYILIGQVLEEKESIIRTATTIGVTGLIVQMVGLLRWTFVVPVLADTFTGSTGPATRSAVIVAFKTIHQFAGVMLGEHLGQLFTIGWTVSLSISFFQLQLFPKWVNTLGLISAAVYLLAQAELFRTVIPGFPVWAMAGFIGSTLWLIWLIITGICFVTIKNIDKQQPTRQDT